MTLHDRISSLDIQEFSLRDAGSAPEAARLVAAYSGGSGAAVPLLVSIDDGRDVAIVRARHPDADPEEDPRQRPELARLATHWQPLKHYTPRIAEGSIGSPSYRLAVTESGINDAGADPAGETPRSHEGGASAPLGLLWVGTPIGTHAGLMVLLGNDGERMVRPDARDWPLPLSRYLGVRIYESR